MPRVPRTVLLPEHGVFHVAVRGVNRSFIVHDDVDWLALRAVVLRAEERFSWRYDAYCLMSSHFHLVVRATRESLSSGMHWLNGIYAQRFNRRHGRSGHLFENRFSARVIESEEHWQESCRYVFDNPVKAGLCEFAADWPWSGGGFLGTRGVGFGQGRGTVPGTRPKRTVVAVSRRSNASARAPAPMRPSARSRRLGR
jgi:REP element-mobilizing transposase RayT